MMRNSYAQIRETDSVRIHKETKNSDPGVFYCYPHGIELIGRDINYVPVSYTHLTLPTKA